MTLIVARCKASCTEAQADIRTESKGESDLWVGLLCGAIFGFGLVLSGMCRRSKIAGFLTLNDNWDPSLALVMLSALTVNTLTFRRIIHGRGRPLLCERLHLPAADKKIDATLLAGAALFGFGWGICGMCPGPGLVNFFTMPHMAVWVPSLAAG